MIGLAIASAACGPKILRVPLSTRGIPEVLLTLAGLTAVCISILGLLKSTQGGFRQRWDEIESQINGRHAFGIGLAIGIPAFRFLTRYIVEIDSARIIAAVVHARNYGLDGVRTSQEAIMPHLFYRPALALFGLPGASVFGMTAVVLLVGVTALLAWRWTHSLIAVIASAMVLFSMSFTLTQASKLPLYAPMLFCGYLGAEAVYAACRSEGRRWVLLCASAAIALVAAPEFQTVGQLFLAAPLVAAIASPFRRRLKTCLLTYGFIAVATIPRIVSNYSIDGLRYIRSGRVEWMVQRGYLAQINDSERDIPSHFGYLLEAPRLAALAIGLTGLLLIAVALGALLGLRRRVQVAVLVAITINIGALAVQRPGNFPRYLSPLLVGIAILVGSSIARVLAQSANTRWRRPRRIAMTSLLLVLASTGLVEYRESLAVVHLEQRAARASSALTIANLIGDATVLGVRAPILSGYSVDLDPLGAPWLTESEFRTYLEWESDEKVLALLKAHNVEYVAVTEGSDREIEYHALWLEPKYGTRPRHLEMLIRTRNFCPVWRLDHRALYRAGACSKEFS